MIHNEIANLLKRATGLDIAAIGSSTIERAVQHRQSACGLADEEAYLNHLLISELEVTELIEAVVVPETWFFRQREALAEVARLACDDWLPAHPTRVLRLLSLPCSTGEEPYSIVMALLDAGVSASRFQVEAVDISEQALTLARRAEYGRNSFRGGDLNFRDRHFTLMDGRWKLRDDVRSLVHFQHGNIMSAGFFPGVEIFDVIFCRNLMIYFDRAGQEHAVSALRRLLTPKGVLFVGPSESSLLLGLDFVSAKIPRACALHKLTKDSGIIASKPGVTIRPGSHSPPHIPPGIRKPGTTIQNGRGQVRPPPEPGCTPETEIGEAISLADKGRLAEAEKLCEEHIRKHGASAQTLYLIGLIRDTRGDISEASQYYRKALYLDQYHQAALGHLALLLTKQGDLAGALVLRARMSRIQQKRAK
jgi:chemotaxis protein methyltransferase WspC